MLGKFLSFDNLIGEALIKIIYYIGLVLICIGGLIGLFNAFGMFRYGFMSGLGMLVLTPIFFVLSVLYWRFLCEMFIVLFAQYNKVSKIAEAVVKKDTD